LPGPGVRAGDRGLIEPGLKRGDLRRQGVDLLVVLLRKGLNQLRELFDLSTKRLGLGGGGTLALAGKGLTGSHREDRDASGCEQSSSRSTRRHVEQGVSPIRSVGLIG
jgi:hypothetical protein